MRRIPSVALVIALAVPTMTLAQAVPALAKPGTEINKLSSMMVGTWTYEGTVKAGPFSPAGKVTGTDTYEMGPGGFSVPHRWEEKGPLGTVKGLEVLSYDAVKKSYTYNYFSSAGEMGSGTAPWTGNTITWTGSGTTYEGKPAWGRCTWTIANPTSFAVKCDASADGKTWINGTFEGKFTKSK
jgi:hypothetical protein